MAKRQPSIIMLDVITIQEVQDTLAQEGFPYGKQSVADGEYVLPTKDAIEEFGKRFGKFLWNAGLGTWLEEIWDCDDFALAAKTLSSIDTAIWRKKTGNLKCGLAFGICWVLTDRGGHAINFAIQRGSDGGLVVKYFEPQSDGRIGEPFVCLKEVSKESFLSLLWCYV